MYAALNQKQELVYAQDGSNVENDNHSYSCPMCSQVLILKKSKKGKYYFSHQVACGSMDRKRLPGGESSQHCLAKYLLARGSSKSKIEVKLEESGLEIDVLFPPNRIMEYQKSIIPSSHLNKRHQTYLSQGFNPLWITDQSYFKNGKLTKWKKMLLQYCPEYGYHWWSLDVEGERLHLYYRLPLLFKDERWAAHHATWELKENWLEHFDLSNAHVERQVWRGKKYFRGVKYKMSLKYSTQYQSFLYFLAQEGYSLEMCPEWIFYGNWQTPCLVSPTWISLVLIWTFLMQHVGKVILTQDLRSFMKENEAKSFVKVLDFPLIGEKVEEDWLKSVIQIFMVAGNLKRIDKEKWLVV